ncbi:MAG: SPASM domain-containing protein, partial [Clostridia bacterium]|nr:SPASM domain-containing protein [Clostridia bacterium]
FYGGEPLLKFKMIKDTIEYINGLSKKTSFKYSITTNGTLISEEIIDFFNNNNFIYIQYSIDGVEETHDKNRIYQNGKETFSVVSQNAKLLLQRFKGKVIANKVITKNTLNTLPQDIAFLFELGFKEIYTLMDYRSNWNDDDIIVLKEKLIEVSKIYANEMMKENDVVIPVFDEKINSFINDSYNCNENCSMGMKTINVGVDGNFYPCMQFVGNNKYIIGNCSDGIDIKARIDLVNNSKKEIDICKGCDLRKRCKHTCPCKNYALTGDVNGLSPVICEFERILIEISDKMAEELYKNKSKLFIQKYYNDNYNRIRFLEEKIKK